MYEIGTEYGPSPSEIDIQPRGGSEVEALLESGEVRRIIVLGAHPDDQLISGVFVRRLARLADHANGPSIMDITMTKGEAAFDDLPEEDRPGGLTRQALAERRHIENEAGVFALYQGITDNISIFHEDFGDGQLDDNKIAMLEFLFEQLQDDIPTVIITMDGQSAEDHRDHLAVVEVAKVLAVAKGWYVVETGSVAEMEGTILADEDETYAANALVDAHQTQSSLKGELDRTVEIGYRYSTPEQVTEEIERLDSREEELAQAV